MKRLRSDRVFLVLVWVVVSALNLNKAFHIDDTFHLIAAEQIRQHPLEPMSGMVNWRNDPVPMYKGAHPPLYYYSIAAISVVFGTSEPVLHAFQSLFTLLAIWCFHQALLMLRVERTRTAVLLFAFFPVFITGQNLMIDVPLLALILLAFLLFVRAIQDGRLRHHMALAAVLSIAMMMKYSVLPILLLHPLIILLQRDFKALSALLIPLLVLVAWSIWNVHEFGFVHLFAKGEVEFEANPITDFLACCGGLATTTFLFVPLKGHRVHWRIAAWVGPVILTVIGLLVLSGKMPAADAKPMLHGLFVINGTALFLLVLVHFIRTTELSIGSIHDPRCLAFLFALSISSFIILFADFIAARHLLLIYPFLLLMGVRMIDTSDMVIRRSAVIKTVLLGTLLGISDRKFANYYREMAGSIPVAGDQTTWTIGHWGWQWYAEHAGMRSFGTHTSQLKHGDRFVMPQNIDRQLVEMPFDVDLRALDKKWIEADPWTFVSVSNVATLYNTSAWNPVWGFSARPIDTLLIYRVEIGREAAINKVIRNIRSDGPWLQKIQEQAVHDNLPLDTMLRRNAIYVLDQEPAAESPK